MGILERKEREKIKRRQDILDAAKNSFAQKGFLNTTIEQIAQESELSTGTIYLYFSGKEELYVSLIVESYDMLIEKLNETLEQNVAPDERLVRIALTYHEFCKRYSDHYKILNFIINEHKNLNLSPELLNKISEKTDIVFKIVRDIFSEGISIGIFKQIDIWDITSIFWSSLNGIIQTQTSLDYFKGRTTKIEFLIKKNLELMVSAIKLEDDHYFNFI
ncbi:MAG: TetR/AcrR family transcriptional regulator [Pseudomonadota bacterium]